VLVNVRSATESKQPNPPFREAENQRPASAKEWGTHFLVKTKTLGQVYCWKVTKNFGHSAILSAREIEHGRFRALFAASFALRCRMVELRRKTKRSIQQSALSIQPNQHRNPSYKRVWFGGRAGEKASGMQRLQR
jgi:hypothetical protein